MAAKRQKIDDKNYSGNDGSGVGANHIPVRTLCVGPIEADMEELIKGYFEQFGAVNSVEIEQDKDSHIALVEFKMVETAATVLSSNGLHRINSYKVQVKPAEPWQQPDHILKALNDDCLRVILLDLDEWDLFNAADVCVRFQQQAKSVFLTKFKHLKLNSTYLTYERMEHLLRTFGSVAQSIDIGSEALRFMHNRYKIQILATIAQCCTSVLKEVTLRGFDFDAKPDSFGIKSDSELKSLDKLTLIECDLHHILNEFLYICGELKVLHLKECVQSLNQLNWPKMNKLEELRLDVVRNLDTGCLKRIIEMCPTLKKISIIAYRREYVIIPSEIIRNIVQHLPNLLELGFNVPPFFDIGFTESIRCLGQLKSLKVLKLTLYWRPLALEALTAALKENATPIEHMELSCGSTNSDAIKDIAQMKELKVLVLANFVGFTDEHMLGLAKGLGSRLEKLELKGSTALKVTTIGVKDMLPFATKLSLFSLESRNIEIDADDYQEILRILQKRPEKVMLQLSGAISHVKVAKKILVKNRDILYIDRL